MNFPLLIYSKRKDQNVNVNKTIKYGTNYEHKYPNLDQNKKETRTRNASIHPPHTLTRLPSSPPRRRHRHLPRLLLSLHSAIGFSLSKITQSPLHRHF